jgi:hypothetical protein
MLSLNAKSKNVEAVLCLDMVIRGEDCAAGEVVELPEREFRYLAHFDRVLPATGENVAAVKAAAKAKRAAAERRAAAGDELTDTKAKLALAMAELERLKKGK